MKKIIVIVLLLAFIVTPAQAIEAQQGSSFLVSVNARGLLMNYKFMTNFNAAMFSTITPGGVILDGDTFRSAAGLWKVTGRCFQSVYPYAPLQIYSIIGDQSYLLAYEPDNYSIDFSFATDAREFKLGVKMYMQAWNELKCQMVTELVK
jgi:hypothetical protein